jgi:fructan beta-fructosidase
VRSFVDLRRPRLHFTPAAHWINDPNGLVFHGGEYHLFYQYHPGSTVWGPMHWGHAVSRDLVTWQELPIALYPDELGMIFSGSAVIDQRNTAGFGEDAMIAIFTHHIHADHQQSQSIAYSLDNGRSWTQYTGNPVIATPPETRDFRDPKVFWYGDGENGHWVMCLAVGRAIHFYTSPNLREWSFSGRFGDTFGCTVGVWETPDLFELPVEGSDQRRWVLLVGVGDGAPAGGSGQQYFVGNFDGDTFTSENPPDLTLWADYGADFYAAQSWSNAPDDRRLVIAWMNNWRYARNLPTEGWRGAMTLPRLFTLHPTAQGPRLRQSPAVSLAETVGADTVHADAAILEGGDCTRLQLPGADAWQIDVQLTLTDAQRDHVVISLAFGDGADAVQISYLGAEQSLLFDRTQSGNVDFHPDFAAVHRAPLVLQSSHLDLQIIVDSLSVELFAHDGLLSITELIFPRAPLATVEIDARQGSVEVKMVRATRLAAQSA